MRGEVGPAMNQKKAKMTKKVEAVGRKADPEDFDSIPDNVGFDPPVAFVFRDGKTGKCKCAAFLEMADTFQRKRRGLSKRASIGPMDGMFFEKCAGPFWMKDVEFPLDLLFLDGDGKIVEKSAMPVDREGRNLYPTTKTATEHAVELPLGFCRDQGIEVGDTVLPYGADPDTGE